MENKTLRPIIKYLSDSQTEEIHEGSLEILEETGIKVELEEGLKVLDKAGAKVDYQTGRAWIPRQMVADCLEIPVGGSTRAPLALRISSSTSIPTSGGRCWSMT